MHAGVKVTHHKQKQPKKHCPLNKGVWLETAFVCGSTVNHLDRKHKTLIAEVIMLI